MYRTITGTIWMKWEKESTYILISPPPNIVQINLRLGKGFLELFYDVWLTLHFL